MVLQSVHIRGDMFHWFFGDIKWHRLKEIILIWRGRSVCRHKLEAKCKQNFTIIDEGIMIWLFWEEVRCIGNRWLKLKVSDLLLSTQKNMYQKIFSLWRV